MADFEAGKLVWRLVTVGKQVLQRDQADAQAAFEKTGKAAADASTKIDESGNATERAGKKARETKAPLDEQAKSQKKAGEEAAAAAKKQREQAAAAEKQREAAKDLSRALGVAGAATGALVTLSVAKFAEFDKQMSNTSAATKATAAEQRELADSALDAGADTAYSATEAAAAQEELAKAGQSVSDIVGGSLTGSLALAAAGQLEVARSAEIMATVLTQFRLPAEQAGHVADVLAAGAGKAQGSVDDLSLALSYVGPLANSMGWSLEETAGTIAYFSTQGVQGEKAGTALRGVLAALQAPSAAAAKVMGEYGINVYDANGRMLEAAPLAQELKNKLSGLTDQERQSALGRIFGNESLLAATLLYEGGAKAVSEWTDNVNDSAYAAEQAAQRQDNLAGDIEKLGGAFDTALIRSGSGANDVLREMVQTLTGLVDVFGEAPAPAQATGLALGVATTAALLLASATLAVRARWTEWRTTLDLTNGQMARSAAVAGGVGIALTALGAVLAYVASQNAEMKAGTQEFTDTLQEATGAVTGYTRELIAKKLAEKGAFDGAREAGITQDELTDAIYRGGSAYDDVNRKLRAAHDASGGWNATIGNSINAVKDLNVQLTDAKKRHADVDAATGGATDATEKSATAYAGAAAEVQGLSDKLHELISQLNDSNDLNQAAITANADYREAVDGIAADVEARRKAYEAEHDTLEGFTLSLDRNTTAGAANAKSLTSVAQAAIEASQKQLAVDETTMSAKDAAEAYLTTLERQREEFTNNAIQAGYNADEVKALADQIFQIPDRKAVELAVSTNQAQQDLAAFHTVFENFIRDKENRTIRIGVSTYIKDGPDGQVRISTPGAPDKFADGGVVSGGVRYYAGGGVEHRVAQMARAGAVRVWAEPETEGETYLPHAKSKRATSEMYLAQTAALFGGKYIPASQASSPSPASGGGVVVNIAAINVPPGVTYAEAVSIAKEAVREGVRDALPGGSY